MCNRKLRVLDKKNLNVLSKKRSDKNTIFGEKKTIYGYNSPYVLTKVEYPNIGNDYKEYDWQVYGVDNIKINNNRKKDRND